jgi:hypothetical protein
MQLELGELDLRYASLRISIAAASDDWSRRCSSTVS